MALFQTHWLQTMCEHLDIFHDPWTQRSHWRGMLHPTFFGLKVLHTISNLLQLFHIVVEDFPLESLVVSEAKAYRISTLPCFMLSCH